MKIVHVLPVNLLVFVDLLLILLWKTSQTALFQCVHIHQQKKKAELLLELHKKLSNHLQMFILVFSQIMLLKICVLNNHKID